MPPRLNLYIRTITTLFALAALVPIAINPTLRNDYFRLLAHWRAKMFPPSYVFIGDSITAGGGVWGWRLGYDPLSAINLGESGLVTWQIAEFARVAADYHPHAIVVMAGTNDAIHGINIEEMTADWDKFFTLVGHTNVIITIPSLSVIPDLNVKLLAVGQIVRKSIPFGANVKVIDLNDDLAPTGFIEKRFTSDGVHFTDAAYTIWASKIAKIAP